MHASPLAARSAREPLPIDRSAAPPLRLLPLDGLHRAHGARMVPFAGYAMPVQYPAGLLAEHAQCRARAALFDVSHMGQASLRGPNAARALERLVPGDVRGLKPGRQRYTMLLAEDGCVLDDIMVANHGADGLVLVCNANRKADDFALIAAGADAALEVHENRALLALQGPLSAAVMARLAPGTADLRFMAVAPLAVAGLPCWVSRSGYTGEDGFEISVANADAPALAEALLASPEVELAGLGARDCLRLEAGLCLYGSDLDATTTPVEADLAFVVSPSRRADWSFRGAPAIRAQLADGAQRRRVGLLLDERAVARAGAGIIDVQGCAIGSVTSGTFSPTLGRPIALGYVRTEHAIAGTKVGIVVRGKPLAARVVALPFVPHRYHR